MFFQSGANDAEFGFLEDEFTRKAELPSFNPFQSTVFGTGGGGGGSLWAGWGDNPEPYIIKPPISKLPVDPLPFPIKYEPPIIPGETPPIYDTTQFPPSHTAPLPPVKQAPEPAPVETPIKTVVKKTEPVITKTPTVTVIQQPAPAPTVKADDGEENLIFGIEPKWLLLGGAAIAGIFALNSSSKEK